MKKKSMMHGYLNRIIISAILICSGLVSESQNVVVTDEDSYTVDSSAVLDVYSINKGILIPRMTTTQRNAISEPANGLLVYDETLNQFYFYNGAAWSTFSTESAWVVDADNLYPNDNNYKLGIGTTTPNSKLEVKADASFGLADTLFVVKDNLGYPVFAVFPDGAKVYVDLSKKGGVGGFAVTGRNPTKASYAEEKYLHVTPDSTRIYFNDASITKGSVGGFAVTGRNPTKAGEVFSSLLNFFPDNYFIGDSAGYSNNTGMYNNFFGYKAGAKNYSGSNNMFIGYYAGYNNYDGFENLFMGKESGINNYSGRSNLFIGNRSGYNNYGGYNNTFIGVNSGYSNTSGRYNVFIGDGSGYKHNTGWENIFIGMNAGYNTSGNLAGNVFIGSLAGYDNISGHSNTYIGHHSGWNNTGYGNTFLGYASGESSGGSYNTNVGRMAGTMNTGNYNVFFGDISGRYQQSGSYNVYLGANTGLKMKTGDNNIMIGAFAGGNKPDSTGYNNIYIGYGAGYNAYGSNQLYIENTTADSTSALIWGNFSANKLALNAYVGIGTTAPDQNLHVVGNARITGDIYYGTGATVYTKPDYVFDKTYNKRFSINEIEKFIEKNRHLPWVTSTNNEEDGVNLTRMQFETLEAVENMQLQLIDLNKENTDLKQQINKQQEQIEYLINEINKLKNK